MRLLLVIHRYLGVAVGVLMTVWCLSGFVMIYQPYPRLTAAERIGGLEPLATTGCCDAARPALAGGASVQGASVEMLAGAPVLRLAAMGGEAEAFDLTTGRRLEDIPQSAALAVARAYARGHGLAAAPHVLGLVRRDQWTLERAGRTGPSYRIALGDPARTELYVARRSGLVVQDSSRRERLLSWFGAIPHWLYPLVLRQDAALWAQVVIWSSLTGCFLTFTGLWVGALRFRRYPTGRWSPYRGWVFWHHMTGLVFGVLALTWVTSGLFTMNPWGYLDTDVGSAEQRRLAGAVSGQDLERLIQALPSLAKEGAVQVTAAPLGGRTYLIATAADGRTARLGLDGRPRPLGGPELRQALARIAPVDSLTLLTRGDAYYHDGYDGPALLPAWRARLAGPGHVALYLDPVSGNVAGAVDDVARQARWLRTGLHDLDIPGLTARPLWDFLALLLLAGVTAVAAIGAWLSIRRIGKDVSAIRRRLAGRPRRAQTPA